MFLYIFVSCVLVYEFLVVFLFVWCDLYMMESLQNVQGAIKGAIARAIDNFKKAPTARLSVAYIETRLESLEQQWQVFFKTHLDIIRTIDQAVLHETDYFKNDVYDEVEELYIDFKSDLRGMLVSSKTVNTMASSKAPMESHVRLPEIKIPVFSGNYLEWQTFKELFSGLVHNNKSLDDTQKLYYLKCHLTGDAEQLLKNIAVTSDNYARSWEKLETTYSNKRFLANNILNRMLNQKELTSESANEIKQLLSTTSDCLESLKKMEIDVSSWDILIVHIISRKLDRDTRKAWELNISDGAGKLPTYEELTQFLTGRFRGLENYEDRTKTVNIQPTVKSFHVQTSNVQSFHVHSEKKENDFTLHSCTYCKSAHKITNCKSFAQKSSKSRRDFARDYRLCYICLYNNHSARVCKTNFRCHICNKRHHTLLHPSVVSQSWRERSSVGDESVMRAEGRNAASQVEGSKDKQIISCVSTVNCREKPIPFREGSLSCADGDSRTTERKFKYLNAELTQFGNQIHGKQYQGTKRNIVGIPVE